jgi:hypothetical protein
MRILIGLLLILLAGCGEDKPVSTPTPQTERVEIIISADGKDCWRVTIRAQIDANSKADATQKLIKMLQSQANVNTIEKLKDDKFGPIEIPGQK